MCENQADYRFTWPGSDEAFICHEHVDQLREIADAMGLHLQIISLSMSEREPEQICNQK